MQLRRGKCAESGACLVEFHAPLVLLLWTGCLPCEQEMEFVEVFVVVSMATVYPKNRRAVRPL